MNGLNEDTREDCAARGVGSLSEEIAETRSGVAELPTTSQVFELAVGLLRERGYDCISEDKIDDFTERIDGVLRKRDSLGDGEASGYLRILSVYRSGKRIHVELYNFLKKFPSDSIEMKETSDSLRKLFENQPWAELDIHE